MGKQKTTTADIDHSVMCCNRDCFKSHCARHWRNHNNTEAVNLNPYGEFKCPGYLPKVKRREYAGRDFMNDYLPVQGHTVVKVAPGGASWEFFVLTAEDESMTVLHHQEMGI